MSPALSLSAFYRRHAKVALMFSGGKDALACLELVRPHLDQTIVIWCNTGAAFPEIVEVMDKVRSEVPHFHEVRTNVAESINRNGHPSDVVPVAYTKFGQECTGPKPVMIRSYVECCAENFWVPADVAAREFGCTGVIRGQRRSDAHHSPVPSGTVKNGVEYVFPIEHWSKEDVLSYLENNGHEITERLKMDHSSLDCWNCTAFLSESSERLEYVRKYHPFKHQHVVQLLDKISAAVRHEADNIQNVVDQG